VVELPPTAASPHAVARIPADVFAAGLGCSPALTKAMACLEGREHLAHSTPLAIASAMAFSTWSCLHLYLPSPSAFEQQLRMGSRVPQWACWWLPLAPYYPFSNKAELVLVRSQSLVLDRFFVFRPQRTLFSDRFFVFFYRLHKLDQPEPGTLPINPDVLVTL